MTRKEKVRRTGARYDREAPELRKRIRAGVVADRKLRRLWNAYADAKDELFYKGDKV